MVKQHAKSFISASLRILGYAEKKEDSVVRVNPPVSFCRTKGGYGGPLTGLRIKLGSTFEALMRSMYNLYWKMNKGANASLREEKMSSSFRELIACQN
jgi:hypothetical protein